MDHGILCANEASITIPCVFSLFDQWYCVFLAVALCIESGVAERCQQVWRDVAMLSIAGRVLSVTHVLPMATSLPFFPKPICRSLVICVCACGMWLNSQNANFHWTGSWEFLESSHNFHQVSGAQIKATSAYWCQWMVRSSNFAFLCKAGQIDIAWQQVFTDANPWL